MDNESKYLYNYLKYDDLKKETLEYISKIGYNKWNYYGEHDPGITILENLIFAIIDFDYRLSFPIEDLLTKNPKDKGELKMFYSPEEILPMNPVTLLDYYKLILDIDNVKNCRIIPRNNNDEVIGLYDIYIQVEPFNEKQIEKTKKEVKSILYQNRNICEDFNKIDVFEQINISIDIDIEVDHELKGVLSKYEGLAGYLLAYVQNYLVPGIKFRKLSDLLNKGINLEDIYNGPMLNHGFILDEDIYKYSLKTNIFIIDIIEFINKIPYINTINNLTIRNINTNEIYVNCITLKENQVLRVDFKKSNIKIFSNYMNVAIDKDKYIALAKRQYYALNIKDIVNDEEIGVYEGNYRNLLEYSSIQNDFPLIYGVGEEGLSNSVTDKIKEDCHHLKCFLLLFDQIFYKYQVIIENLKNFYSIESENYVKSLLVKDVPLLKTLIKPPSNYKLSDNIENDGYYIQRKYIIKRHDKNIIFNKNINEYLNFIDKEVDIYSRKDIIDYLLMTFFRDNFKDFKNNLILAAYFNYEKKQEYLSNCISIEKEKIKGMILHNDDQWEGINISGLEKKISLFWNINNFNRRMLHLFLQDNIFKWSTGYKDNYVFESKDIEIRYTCKYKNIIDLVLNYGNVKENYIIEKYKNEITNNESSQDLFKIKISINLLNKFIYLIVNHDILSYEEALAIVDKSIKKINDFNKKSEGFHLIENILLRPSDNSLSFKNIKNTDNDEKNKNTIDEDVFSCRITIVFPNWPVKFQNNIFRESISKWLYENCPAHIKVDILWLNFNEMNVFENMYKYWYEVFNSKTSDDNIKDKTNLKFINLIQNLKNKNERTNFYNNNDDDKISDNNTNFDININKENINITKNNIDKEINTNNNNNENIDNNEKNINNSNENIDNNEKNINDNNENIDNNNKNNQNLDFDIFNNPIK